MGDNHQEHSTPLHLERQTPSKSFPKAVLIVPIIILLAGGLYIFSKRSAFIRKLIPIINRNKQEFKITESYPEDFDKSVSVRTEPTFVFTKKINTSEKELSKYLVIQPAVQGTWHKEENGKVIYFSSNIKVKNGFPEVFKPNSLYTITIKKDIQSEEGDSLTKDATITFRTKGNDQFAYSVNKKLINTLPDRELRVDFFSQSSANQGGEVAVKATIYRSAKDEVLNYFSYKTGKGSLYAIRNKGVETKALDVSLKPNEGNFSMTLPPFEEPGIYYVVASNANGEDDFFVTVSSHIHHAILSDDAAEIWSTDGSKGKKVEGVQTEAYTIDGKPKLLSTVKGDNDGLTTYTGSADILVSQKDNNVSFIYTPRYNKYEWRRTSDLKAFSYTDRPVYRPGDTVHYKAIVRGKKNSNYTYPTEKLYIKFLTQLNLGDKDYKEVSLDSNGTVTYDLKLPQSSLSSPSIILAAKYKNGYLQVDSRDIKVESYRKPDIDMGIITDEKEYISSDTAHMALSAKTMYGEPMSNVSYSYRVLAMPFTEIKDRTLERLNEYTFYGDGKELAAGRGKFDESGQDAIEFSTDLKDLPESQIITLEVLPNMAMSPSVGRIVKLVHRGEFALFIEDMNANIDEGIKGIVSVLNHHSPREAIANQQITLTLYKDPYERKQPINSQSVTSSSDGSAQFEFEDIPAGTYELGAQSNDARGNAVTSYTYVYVSESKQKNPNLPTYLLELHTDKDITKTGETVTVTGKANYEIGDALLIVTGSTNKGPIAGSSILQKQVVTINSDTISFPIKVPDVDTPLSVSLLSSHDGEGIIGSVDIKLETEDKRILTTIQFNKSQVKPRESVKAEILTTQNGKPVSADTSLSIVDKAILEIGKFNAVIFDAFYQNIFSSVPATYDSATGIYNDREPGGGGGCFVAGTQILMKDGSTKNIEDIKIGEEILTRQSDASSLLTQDKVVKIWRHIVDEYIVVNGTFKVTPIHRVFINNRWTEMSEARVGDSLIDAQGNFITITSLQHVKGQYVVYNLTTEKYHTFFADGFYVHNDKGPGPRQNFADTIYWNPHIKTNAEGKAEVAFTTPDNITTFTAQAFSNTVSAFGQANAEIISKKDLVIIPAIPSVIYQGDKPILSAVLQNTTDQEVEGTVSLTIKDLNLQKEQEVKIKANSWSNVRFPVEINTKKQSLTINIALKGKGGSNLDEIQLTKKVTPQGNILSSWFSFTGSKNFSFEPQYRDLDANNISIYIYSHPAIALAHNYLFNNYVDDSPSISLGTNLYLQAYLMDKTQRGLIEPTVYNYPSLRNTFRENIQMLLNRQMRPGRVIYWTSKYNKEESPLQITAWTILALREMQNTNISTNSDDTDSIIKGAEQYVSDNQGSDIQEDLYMSSWIMNKRMPKCDKSNEYLECLAVQALQGDGAALQNLRNMKMETADDRYMWNTRTAHGQALPALAMIRKGTDKEADKTIKGLAASFDSLSYDSRSLAYVAAIDHIVKNNLPINKPVLHITANGDPVMDMNGETIDQLSVINEIPLIGLSTDNVEVSVKQESGIPLYVDVIATEYTSNNSVSITASGIENEKKHEPALTRKLRKIDGSDTDTLDEGESGIVELSMPNLAPSFNYGTSKGMVGIGNIIYLEDAISPGYMFLNQMSDNSPQYQSALANIYRGQNEYEYRYVSYANYSDQFVNFRGNAQYEPVVMPYVVYKINKGSYYQPKATAVYPRLGVVIREK